MIRAKNVKSRTPLFFKQRLIVFAAMLALALAGAVGDAGAQVAEDFENINLLPARGWFMRNNSVPLGTTGWQQGSSAPFSIPAQAGAPYSYIAADFFNASGAGTISNWLVAPTRTLHNGDIVRFWTRTTAGMIIFPDRLEVRLSTNGASTNVGTGAEAVGDFTTLLLTVNPDLTTTGYPGVWTLFTLVLDGLPPQGVDARVAFRYYVTNAGPDGDNSNHIYIDSFSINHGDLFAPEAPFDFDGDGRTDFVVVRNTGGGANGQETWFINNGTTHTQTPWGIAGDIFVTGDFDADDRSDITAYRRSTGFFYTLRSSDGTLASCNLGGSSANDNPTVIGDYDGDDVDDYAVYRQGASPGQQSFWIYRSGATPSGTPVSVQWGLSGDFPAPGDYDGDGINDFCVRRNPGNGQGAFYLKKSNGGDEAVLWGNWTDFVVPGDYDGDGKDDFAVVRGDNQRLLWSVLGRNQNNIIHYGEPWGVSTTDLATPGDYDGDGKIDIAVWRAVGDDPTKTYFYVRKSSNGALQASQWGQNFDYPLAFSNAH
jgi:hypothetical protein